MRKDMPANQSPICPQCSLGDKVYKVSLLYLESSARLNRRERSGQPELDSVLVDLLPENNSRAAEEQTLTGLQQTFSPPSGAKRAVRRIHPDAMVGVFSIFAIMLLYRIYLNQSAAFPYALIFLTAAGLFYLMTRNKVLTRYNAQVQAEQEENARIQKEVSHWMRLYFCTRDRGVFYPDSNRFAPAEEIRSFLRNA